MKKLMFVAAAVAASVVIADGITSNNIVGYNSVNDGAHAAAAVGGLFIPVDGSETFPLKNIKVTPTAEETYMDPEGEYVQVLDPDTTEVIGRYTYVSKEWVDAMFPEEDPECAEERAEFLGYIGWWDYEKIGEEGSNRNEEPIEVGQAMLGYLYGIELNFTSSGEVPLESTAICGANAATYFYNYLPVDGKKLKDFTVSPTPEQVDAEEGVYFDPEGEYFQVLDTDTTEVTARLVYVSKEWVDAMFPEEDPECAEERAEFLGYIGWWDYEMIGEEGHNQDELDMPAGAAFLGYLYGSGWNFNVPAAL